MKTTSPTDIDIQHGCQASGVPDDPLLSHWARSARDAVNGAGSITLRIVDAEESRQLNAGYRGKDQATNVLSFPFSMPEGLPAGALPDMLGDLAICADVVAREAAEQDKPLAAHWAHMVVHGVLHLLGHDHQDDQQAQQMEQLECRILASLGFDNPYQNDTAATAIQE